VTDAVKTYLLLVFAASIIIAAIAGFKGGLQGGETVLFGFAAMLSPALAAWLASRIRREPVGWLGTNRFSWGYLPMALFAIPLLQHAVGLTVTLILLGHLPWSPGLNAGSDGMIHPAAALHLGDSITTAGLVRGLLLKALVGLVVISLFALTEEIGWRGFMQRRIIEKQGVTKGIAISAALWAAWHSPYALSGLHHIAGVSTAEMLLIMPIGHFGLGMFLGWIYCRTHSIWLVALAHGSANNWGQFAFRFMDADSINLQLAVANNMALFALGIAILLLLRRRSTITADLQARELTL